MNVDRVLRSRRVMTPEGERPACVAVAGGHILAVLDWEEAPAGVPVEDFGEAVLMPGVVDTHVHLNEPGRAEWEGFRTGTRAAAAGGTTTLVDMPLNSIPATTTVKALEEKRAAARDQCAVDVGFWGGAVPGNARELAPMAAAGARGFKAFLVDSGVEEFGWVSEPDLASAMAELARLPVPLLVHAEVAGPIDAATPGLAGRDERAYATYLASRPPSAEEEAIRLVVRLQREHRARVHVVHHSAASALAIVGDAKREGLPLTAETCPHYLRFAAEDIPDGATEYKCAPPIREAANREALWAALEAGVLDLVASDHSPCTPALKRREAGDFAAAWGGIAGLQLALSVVWTEARRRGFDLARVVYWMCAAPARLAGLSARKGSIAPGLDADLVVFDPEASFRVAPDRLRHRHAVTPYLGAELWGTVRTTYLRGERVFHDGECVAGARGEFL